MAGLAGRDVRGCPGDVGPGNAHPAVRRRRRRAADGRHPRLRGHRLRHGGGAEGGPQRAGAPGAAGLPLRGDRIGPPPPTGRGLGARFRAPAGGAGKKYKIKGDLFVRTMYKFGTGTGAGSFDYYVINHKNGDGCIYNGKDNVWAKIK